MCKNAKCTGVNIWGRPEFVCECGEYFTGIDAIEKHHREQEKEEKEGQDHVQPNPNP